MPKDDTPAEAQDRAWPTTGAVDLFPPEGSRMGGNGGGVKAGGSADEAIESGTSERYSLNPEP